MAENYSSLLSTWGIDAVEHDVLNIASHRRNFWWSSVYFLLIRKLPCIWRWLYFNWNRLPGFDFYRKYVLPIRFRATRKLLLSTQPDLVISTHPLSTSIVNHLKRRGHLTSPLWVAISDWHLQPFWIFPEATRYLVPLPAQKKLLLGHGIPSEQVSVIGMLLRNSYYEAIAAASPKSIFELRGIKPVILVMGGGVGWALERVLMQLRTVKAQFVVIAGTEQRKQQLLEFLYEVGAPENFEIHGYVDPLEYMSKVDLIIAKPGGLSTAEAITVSKPLLLMAAMPGHEEENAQVLAEYGIPWARDLEDLPMLVNDVLTRRSSCWSLSSDLRPAKATPRLLRDLLELEFAHNNPQLPSRAGSA